jgi:hypothetical protein
MTPSSYKHTQFGTLTVTALVAAIGFLSVLGARTSWKMIPLITVFILIVQLLIRARHL